MTATLEQRKKRESILIYDEEDIHSFHLPPKLSFDACESYFSDVKQAMEGCKDDLKSAVEQVARQLSEFEDEADETLEPIERVPEPMARGLKELLNVELGLNGLRRAMNFLFQTVERLPEMFHAARAEIRALKFREARLESRLTKMHGLVGLHLHSLRGPKERQDGGLDGSDVYVVVLYFNEERWSRKGQHQQLTMKRLAPHICRLADSFNTGHCIANTEKESAIGVFPTAISAFDWSMACRKHVCKLVGCDMQREFLDGGIIAASMARGEVNRREINEQLCYEGPALDEAVSLAQHIRYGTTALTENFLIALGEDTELPQGLRCFVTGMYAASVSTLQKVLTFRHSENIELYHKVGSREVLVERLQTLTHTLTVRKYITSTEKQIRARRDPAPGEGGRPKISSPTNARLHVETVLEAVLGAPSTHRSSASKRRGSASKLSRSNSKANMAGDGEAENEEKEQLLLFSSNMSRRRGLGPKVDHVECQTIESRHKEDEETQTEIKHSSSAATQTYLPIDKHGRLRCLAKFYFGEKFYNKMYRSRGCVTDPPPRQVPGIVQTEDVAFSGPADGSSGDDGASIAKSPVQQLALTAQSVQVMAANGKHLLSYPSLESLHGSSTYAAQLLQHVKEIEDRLAKGEGCAPTREQCTSMYVRSHEVGTMTTAPVLSIPRVWDTADKKNTLFVEAAADSVLTDAAEGGAKNDFAIQQSQLLDQVLEGSFRLTRRPKHALGGGDASLGGDGVAGAETSTGMIAHTDDEGNVSLENIASAGAWASGSFRKAASPARRCSTVSMAETAEGESTVGTYTPRDSVRRGRGVHVVADAVSAEADDTTAARHLRAVKAKVVLFQHVLQRFASQRHDALHGLLVPWVRGRYGDAVLQECPTPLDKAEVTRLLFSTMAQLPTEDDFYSNVAVDLRGDVDSDPGYLTQYIFAVLTQCLATVRGMAGVSMCSRKREASGTARAVRCGTAVDTTLDPRAFYLDVDVDTRAEIIELVSPTNTATASSRPPPAVSMGDISLGSEAYFATSRERRSVRPRTASPGRAVARGTEAAKLKNRPQSACIRRVKGDHDMREHDVADLAEVTFGIGSEIDVSATDAAGCPPFVLHSDEDDDVVGVGDGKLAPLMSCRNKKAARDANGSRPPVAVGTAASLLPRRSRTKPTVSPCRSLRVVSTRKNKH